jgi:hypothetical protein
MMRPPTAWTPAHATLAPLQTQHDAGRRVTDSLLRLATQTAFKDDDGRRQLAQALRQYIRMYLPHESREDTVLFPAFRKLVSGNEYDALGEEFEKKEHQLFGERGFQEIVDKVAGIERQLGIYDLAQLTPKPSPLRCWWPWLSSPAAPLPLSVSALAACSRPPWRRKPA